MPDVLAMYCSCYLMKPITEDDLRTALSKLCYPVPEVISAAYGRMRIVRDLVQCDYFDYLDGKNTSFCGEYMPQYSFAEVTCAALTKQLG